MMDRLNAEREATHRTIDAKKHTVKVQSITYAPEVWFASVFGFSSKHPQINGLSPRRQHMHYIKPAKFPRLVT